MFLYHESVEVHLFKDCRSTVGLCEYNTQPRNPLTLPRSLWWNEEPFVHLECADSYCSSLFEPNLTACFNCGCFCAPQNGSVRVGRIYFSSSNCQITTNTSGSKTPQESVALECEQTVKLHTTMRVMAGVGDPLLTGEGNSKSLTGILNASLLLMLPSASRRTNIALFLRSWLQILCKLFEVLQLFKYDFNPSPLILLYYHIFLFRF